MTLARLAAQSLWNRRLTAILTVISLALSVALLLGVEKVRTAARQSFADTISGTDLIVGARGGNIQLLLASVFRIGAAGNNVTWQTYQDIKKRREVAWTVPISLGDSVKGFHVLGTTGDYFDRYRFRRTHALAFTQGTRFKDLFDAVLGADVAIALGLKLGDPVTIGHGLGRETFIDHGDKPFRVAGILAKTGTPADRTVHVSLEAIEAIHVDWQSGAPVPGATLSAEQVRQMTLTPKSITSVLVGVTNKAEIFRLQRWLNGYTEEPLTSILPGVTLQELWEIVGTAETALSAVSALVVATALLGMMTTLLTTLEERRREMAILRSVGAGPRTVLGLLGLEATLLTLAGVTLGTALLYGGLAVAQPLIDRVYGLHLTITPPGLDELMLLLGVSLGGALAGVLPAFRAYRLSLADGMMVRT